MSTINQAYIDALLADAAYVDVTPSMNVDALTVALQKSMTPTLAAYLAANFEVASSINTSDIPLIGSGFDATVWRIKSGSELAGSNNENAGKTYVSMRGTELLPGADVLADGDLVVGSAATSAVIDMVNWWLRETTPTADLARQIKWDPLHQPNPASIEIVPSFVDDTRVAGAGHLVGVTSVQIDGHSLGGHMASAFARIFGAGNGVAGSVNVQSIATFNSAGFNGANSEPLFQRIQALLGTGYSSFASVNNKQTNLFAANGINVTTNDWWFTQMGTRTGLYQEETAGIANHYMYKLTDALALGSMLGKLDRSFTFDKLNELIKVGSNVMAGSYEGVLDALLRMLVAPNIDPTPIGDAGDSAASRVRYHEVIAALLKSKEAAFTSLEGKLIIKASIATDLIAAARDNFGALVALQDLSPFVLSGISPAVNDVLDFFLESGRAGDCAAWEVDKSSDWPATFTDQWITDRATLLGVLLERNKFDQTGVLNPNPSVGLVAGHYLDVNSGVDITVGLDTLTGRDAGDHLYGGGGVDTLDGQGSSDYLEGNADDDVLMGGKSNDILLGGKGNDTYKYTKGDGLDTILDSDGQGSIVIDGQTLSGGAQYGDARVYRDANGHVYTNVGIGLVIDGNIFVQNWQAGDLGINLNPALADANPTTGPDIFGDRAPIDQNLATPYLEIGYDLLDNIITNPNIIQANVEDILYVSAANDHIVSGSGRDHIFATRGGDDLIDAKRDDAHARAGNGCMRRRTCAATANRVEAANDETTHTWRDAA